MMVEERLSLRVHSCRFMSQLLVTGGAGFVGSHTCLALLQANHRLVVLDNYVNSSADSLERVCDLVGLKDRDALKVVQGDVRSPDDLNRVFQLSDKPIEAVLHFAGLKAVGESISSPLHYWDINVTGTRCLLQAMQSYGCKTIVFSSSATLYGSPKTLPITENSLVDPTNTYGNTKAAVERLLRDLVASEDSWRVACLRYFNPVGAHPSGTIGESPQGIPNNLFPVITKVALGQIDKLKIFGGDWPTEDGTAVRDYIHVMDLAEGHCFALELLQREDPQLLVMNLGTGTGYSVLEVVKAFEKACGVNVPYEIINRRPGDVACTIADPTLAQKKLGWRTKFSLDAMCLHSWSWQKDNPNGYIN